jgi:hypothetical protein
MSTSIVVSLGELDGIVDLTVGPVPPAAAAIGFDSSLGDVVG